MSAWMSVSPGFALRYASDQVIVDVLEEGELRVRRGAVAFGDAFGALTGTYPPGYLERLDAEDEQR